MHNYSTCMQKCLLLCFNSVFFTNQVTYVVTEVVPFCKSGHKYSKQHWFSARQLLIFGYICSHHIYLG